MHSEHRLLARDGRRCDIQLTVAELDAVVAEFQEAARAFAKGNPEPVKELFSHADDVTLANSFGPAVTGWEARGSARLRVIVVSRR